MKVTRHTSAQVVLSVLFARRGAGITSSRDGLGQACEGRMS